MKGQVLVLAVIVVGLVLMSTLALISGSVLFSQNTRYSIQSAQALNLAEAGLDKAVAALNATGGVYNGQGETFLGPGSFSITVTNKTPSTSIIQAIGYVPNKTNPKSKRTIQVQVSKGIGVSFNYGVQIGEGGLYMENNAKVTGSVYSNGNIAMDHGSIITGDAYVAGGIQPTADQQSDCVEPDCGDYIFGKSVAGQSRQDVAQSFSPGEGNVLNKVSLKLKKVGVPSGNPTVRLMGDTGGKPNKGNIIAFGTLNSSLVNENYGLVDVTFNTTPILAANTTYWIMVHSNSLDNNNYWVWSQDNLQSYTRGQARWSSNWQASTPAWNSINADLGFKTYMGGIATSITGLQDSLIQGSAHAHHLQALTINNDAYYQTSQSITVGGTSHPNSEDPAPQAMSISDNNIQDWKDEAMEGGTYTGDIISCPSTLSRGRYVGSIKLSNHCNTTADSPIWITGNLELDNGAVIKLNPGYNASSGIIIVDGTIKLDNNGQLKGSGVTGSYLLALSNYDSTTNNNTAIEAENGSTSVILYANKGKIVLENNTSLREVTAWKLYLNNNASVTYDSGLAGLFFSSGPSGSYSLMKGTYQLK